MANSDRLEGWKSIGDYLGVTVKTAQRWEKDRGLPVHSLPGGDKRTVYVLKSEIEAWRVRDVQAEGRFTATPPPQARGWVWVLVILIAVASLAAYHWTRPGSAVRVTVNGQDILGWDADGRVAWRYAVQEPVHPPDKTWIQMTNPPNAEPGFVVALKVVGERDQSLVYSLTAQGRLSWTYRPETILRFGRREFQGPWVVPALLGANNGASTAVAAVVHHNWWPAFLVELDAGGRPKTRFIHAGHIYALYRHRTASGFRFLAGGVSNEHDGAMLAILPENSGTATMPEERDPRFHCDDCGSTTPERYYVLPRCELNLADTQPYNKVESFLPDRDGVLVLTRELELAASTGVRYNLSRDLRMESFSLQDSFWDVHRRLEREGKIHHTAAECPERLGRSVLEWTPQQGWRTLKIPPEESLPMAR